MKTQKGFAVLEGLLILVIIAIIGGTGWYAWHNNHNATPVKKTALVTSSKLSSNKSAPQIINPAPFKLPDNWTWYVDTQYGFKAAYPNAWGSPQFSKSDGSKGSSYWLSFHSAPIGVAEGVTANLILDSTDYVFSGCNDSRGCTDVPTSNTAANVRSNLQAMKGKSESNGSMQPVIYNDDSSYITILTNPGEGETDLLDGYQIISLPAINVDAAHLAFELLKVSGDCSQNKVSPESTQPCITQSTLDNVSGVLKSIQSL